MARRKKGKVFNILLLVGVGVGGYWLWKTGRLQAVTDWFSGLGAAQAAQQAAAQQAAQQAAAQQAAAQQAEALRQKAIIDAAAAAAAVLAAGATAAGGTAAPATVAAGGTAAGLTPAQALWGAFGISVPLWVGLSPQAPKLAGDIGHWLDKTIFGIEPWEPGQVTKRPATVSESERAKCARMLPPGTSIKGMTNAQVCALARSLS